MLLFEEIEPQQARALLESAMKATREPKTPPPVSDSYSAFHAFARARLKALPPGRKRPAPLHIEAPYSRERRAMLAAEFLASDEAEDLSDPSAASRCADHIIDYGCEQDFNRPLRVSPTKCETFLLDWLPRKVCSPRPSSRRCRTCWSRGYAWPRATTGLADRGDRRPLDAVCEAMPQLHQGLPGSASFGLDRRCWSGCCRTATCRRCPPGLRVRVLAGHLRGIDLGALDPASEADRRILLEADHDQPAGRATRSTSTGTRRSPSGSGTATRRSSGRRPSGCSTSVMTSHDVLHALIEALERTAGPDTVRLDDIGAPRVCRRSLAVPRRAAARREHVIDLNADLGEAFGAWRLGDDAALLDIVTSANVACGFHAGDPLTIMRAACAAAVERGVAIGAQVTYRDLAGFGRREMDVQPDELTAEVLYQIAALDGIARARAPGLATSSRTARSTTACRDAEQAAARDRGGPRLRPGAAGARAARLGAAARRPPRPGCAVVTEAFADRAYARRRAAGAARRARRGAARPRPRSPPRRAHGHRGQVTASTARQVRSRPGRSASTATPRARSAAAGRRGGLEARAWACRAFAA